MNTAPAREQLVDLAADGIEVSVSTLGAEARSIRGPDGHEYLWPAHPPWPRHAPVLFPHICSQPGDRIVIDGTHYPASHHGFARDRDFDIVSASTVHLTLRLSTDAWTLQRYPYRFKLEVTYRIVDAALCVSFEVQNAGTAVMPFALGWHPALNWPLDANPGQHRLEFDESEPAPIRRMAGGFLDPQRADAAAARGLLPLDQSLFREGALIIEHPRSSRVRYRSPSGRAVHMSWTGFNALAVWSPHDADLVCIEPWLGLPASAESMEWIDRPELTHLQPGDTLHASVTVAPTPNNTTVPEEWGSGAVSTALAQHIHDLARRAAESRGLPAGIVVRDERGDLVCCSRTDHADRSVLDAAMAHPDQSSGGLSSPPIFCRTDGLLTVAAATSTAAQHILTDTADELVRFDQRYRYNLSSH